MSLIVIDTETTHRYPERALILEAAAVVLVDGKITNQFTSLVHRRDDELAGAEEAMAVNGITRDMLQGAPEPAYVRGLLHDFISVNHGQELTSFNVQYDQTVLYVNQWEVPGVPWGKCIMLEAADWMGRCGALPWNTRYGNYKWPSLMEAMLFFKIEPLRQHRALGDALVAAQIWMKMHGYP
jgi:DNA polymerase III epsilon subunit-like protein